MAKSTHRLALCGAAGQPPYSHRRTGCAKNHNNNTWSLFEVLAKGCTDTRAGAAACSVIARELPHSRRCARTYAGARETQKRFDVIRQRNICAGKPSPPPANPSARHMSVTTCARRGVGSTENWLSVVK